MQVRFASYFCLVLVLFKFSVCKPVAAGGQNRDSGSEENLAVQGELHKNIPPRMKAAQLPGLAAVVVSHGRIVLAHGYGVSDLETGQPVTPHTLFKTASISKTLVATAVMQLVEKRKIELDEDIRSHLPFGVRNPHFGDRIITPRMLLSHTSSIRDGPRLWDYVAESRDYPVALSVFLQGYLTPGGKFYQSANWSREPPGRVHEYSNVGAALAGALVERVSGEDLQGYCKHSIFDPLEMKESSWFLSGLDRTKIAVQYQAHRRGGYERLGLTCHATYPDGQLRSSAIELAHFLMMVMAKGNWKGRQILSRESVHEMLGRQSQSHSGLFWQRFTLNNRILLGHSGIDRGSTTDMWFDPGTHTGFVVLANGSTYWDHYDEYKSGRYGQEIRAILAIERDLLALGDAGFSTPLARQHRATRFGNQSHR